MIYRTGLEMHGVAAEPEEDSRYNLSAILITPEGKVAATNGRQFLRIDADVDEPDLFTEQVLGETPGEELEAPVTIPADVAKAFLAASKRKGKGEKAQQIVVVVKDGAVELATADGKTKRRFIIEPDSLSPFPAIDRVIPKSKPVATITLGVDELSLLLGTLRRCGVKSFDIGYHAPTSPLRITATGWGDGDAEMAIDGALMPLARPEDKDADETPANVDTETGELLDGAAA